MFFDENKEVIQILLSPITQEDLATEVGVVKQTISNAFSGNGSFPVSEQTKDKIVDVAMEKLRQRIEAYNALLKEYKRYKKVFS